MRKEVLGKWENSQPARDQYAASVCMTAAWAFGGRPESTCSHRLLAFGHWHRESGRGEAALNWPLQFGSHLCNSALFALNAVSANIHLTDNWFFTSRLHRLLRLFVFFLCLLPTRPPPPTTTTTTTTFPPLLFLVYFNLSSCLHCLFLLCFCCCCFLFVCLFCFLFLHILLFFTFFFFLLSLSYLVSLDRSSA